MKVKEEPLMQLFHRSGDLFENVLKADKSIEYKTGYADAMNDVTREIRHILANDSNA